MTRTGNKLGFMRCLLVTAVAAMSVGALAPALSAQAGRNVFISRGARGRGVLLFRLDADRVHQRRDRIDVLTQ